MSTQDKESFIARWSRRKLDSSKEPAAPKAGVPGAAPRPAAIPAAANSAPADPALPPLDSLRGLASEYKDFLRPGVDEKLRTAALKRLFRDPHFSMMDGLDVYMDDFTKPDPIPEAMLRALERANQLLFPAANKEAPAAEEDSGGGSVQAAVDGKPGEMNPEPQDPEPKRKTA